MEGVSLCVGKLFLSVEWKVVSGQGLRIQKGLMNKIQPIMPRHKMCVCLKIVYEQNKESVLNPSGDVKNVRRDRALNLWMRKV